MTLTSTTGFRAAIGAVSAALLVVLATPTPAFAGNVTVTGSAVDVGEQPGNSAVQVMGADMGESKNVKVSVSATGDAASYVDVKVVAGSCKGNGTTASCGKLRMTETKDFSVQVSLKSGSDLKEGESKTGNLEFRVEGPNTGGGTAPLTVTGFEQVATAITGTIKDLDGKPLKGAKFSTGDYGSDTTGDDGKFSLEAEVEAGTEISYTITKSGYKTIKDTYTVAEGKPIQIDQMMDKKDSTKSKAPKDDGEETEDSGPEDSTSATTWILIILGILLAIGGVIAIWMLLRKGKEDDDDDDDLSSLPPEPPTHTLSASQTGKFGVYEASGTRPGADNPTMMYNGGLINDNDLARYGSEPSSGAGFGPAYGDAARPTQAVQSAHDLPPAGATQRYPSAEPTSGAAGYGNGQYGSTQRYPSAEPTSGAAGYGNDQYGSTQRYPSADPVSGAGRYPNDPVSGAGRYPADPVSGAGRYPADPVSGAGRYPNEPVSGSTQRYPAAEPTSGAWGSNQPVSGSTQRYLAAEPQSGSWNSGAPAPDPRYPSEPATGARYPAADQYYGQQNPHQEPNSGRHYREPGAQGGGYDDQQSQRSSGRRYRDDDYGDYDDRPRSW